MVLIYKGVGPGTHHHKNDLRITGISAASTSNIDVQVAVQHIALGSRYSPCISLTRSYGIAAGYGRMGKYRATRQNPGLVYEIDVPEDTQGIELHDAVAYIADGLKDALTMNSYHHNGDSKFLLSVVDPATFLHLRSVPVVVPPGLGSYGNPVLTPSLVALVNALRDAEILAFRTVPRAWVTNRFDVY